MKIDLNEELKPNTTVIHEISPTSKEVKNLYEVFSWGREAMGSIFIMAK